MHCEGEIMMTLNEIGSRAKEVSRVLGTLGSREKNMGLEEAARALLEGEEEILEANSRDYEKARSGGMSQGLLDRLKLTPARVQAMADGLLQGAAPVAAGQQSQQHLAVPGPHHRLQGRRVPLQPLHHFLLIHRKTSIRCCIAQYMCPFRKTCLSRP